MNELIQAFTNFLIVTGAFTCIMAIASLLVSAYKIHHDKHKSHLPQIKDALHRI